MLSGIFPFQEGPNEPPFAELVITFRLPKLI